MKKGTKIILTTLISLTYTSKAQQVVKKDTLNGTEMSWTMDSQVANALSGLEEKCTSKKTKFPNGGDNENVPIKTLVANRALTNEEICRKNPRISGYKIQVMVAKTNEEANIARGDFRARFPQLKVEVDASLRPNYKVLAGSYFTKESAAADLKKIRKEFNTAVSIPYRIFCVEAK
jgi:hypothetical protein